MTGGGFTYSKRAPFLPRTKSNESLDIVELNDITTNPIEIASKREDWLKNLDKTIKGIEITPMAVASPAKTPRKASRKSEIRPRLSLAPSHAQIEDLLKESNQSQVTSFASWFGAKSSDALFEKIGESSFSEVFKMRKSVAGGGSTASGDGGAFAIKIMPLLRPDGDLMEEIITAPGDGDSETPEPIRLDHLLHEIKCLKALNDLATHRRYAVPSGHTGFNRLVECALVGGPYPEELISAWDKWSTENESLNKRPSSYCSNSLHVILMMEDGGTDLESFSVHSIKQIYAIIAQVLAAISLAETKISFEHRDLHLGNILVKATHRSDIRLESFRSLPTEGLLCSIIDCSLSRFTAPLTGKVIHRDLSLDPWLFTGEADESSQYEVYRKMRTVMNDVWESYNPQTNLLWCQHILQELLQTASKSLKSKEKQLYDSLMAFSEEMPTFADSKAALDKLLKMPRI